VAAHERFEEPVDAYRSENVGLAMAQQEIDFDTASYEQVLGRTGQYWQNLECMLNVYIFRCCFLQ
jgi:hypothetical protein